MIDVEGAVGVAADQVGRAAVEEHEAAVIGDGGHAGDVVALRSPPVAVEISVVVPVCVSRRKTSNKPLSVAADQVGRGALEHDIAAIGRHHAAGGDVVGAGTAAVD
jgi:hypothetical protein